MFKRLFEIIRHKENYVLCFVIKTQVGLHLFKNDIIVLFSNKVTRFLVVLLIENLYAKKFMNVCTVNSMSRYTLAVR
jgi:hypothetical protein